MRVQDKSNPGQTSATYGVSKSYVNWVTVFSRFQRSFGAYLWDFKGRFRVSGKDMRCRLGFEYWTGYGVSV
jgi:hypothetical protein